MKALLMASVAAGLALSFAAPAFADCATEIAALKSANFTGSVSPSETPRTTGATQPAPAGGEVAEQPSAKMTAPAPGTQTGAGLDVAAQTAGQTPETQATPAMNAAVGQSAASPQDVQAQNAGKPTAAQQADMAAAGGTTPSGSAALPAASGAQAQLGVLIQQAENYHKLGNEKACMNVVQQAQQMKE